MTTPNPMSPEHLRNEVAQHGVDDDECVQRGRQSDNSYITRYGRIVKPPKLYQNEKFG